MKIEINDKESYELALPDKITANEFLDIAEKVKLLSGLTSKVTPPIKQIVSEDKSFTIRRRVGRPSKKDRVSIPEGLTCPNCNSVRLQSKGYIRDGSLRRYGCKNCHVSFTPGLQKNEKKSVQRAPIAHRWEDRGNVIKAMRLHYFGTSEEKEEFAKSRGVAWNNIVKAFHNLKARYNVQPSEIGLKEFPGRGFPKQLKKLQKEEEQKEEEKPKKRLFGLLPTPTPPLETERPFSDEDLKN